MLIMIFTHIPYTYIQSLKFSLGLLNVVYPLFYILYCDLFVKLFSRRWSSGILFHNCMLLFVINIHWLVLAGSFLKLLIQHLLFIFPMKRVIEGHWMSSIYNCYPLKVFIVKWKQKSLLHLFLFLIIRCITYLWSLTELYILRLGTE